MSKCKTEFSWTRAALGAVGAVLLATPILIYGSTFGWKISSNHARWAEMGSAMSGIYSPLLALLAFLVVLGQARAQVAMNKHQLDADYIGKVRADLQMYLLELQAELEVRALDGSSRGVTLQRQFGGLDLKDQLTMKHHIRNEIDDVGSGLSNGSGARQLCVLSRIRSCEDRFRVQPAASKRIRLSRQRGSSPPHFAPLFFFFWFLAPAHDGRPWQKTGLLNSHRSTSGVPNAGMPGRPFRI